ncbi:hypothetical protein PPL_02248 [Heterostelium album PN500]|uniref:Uncharacterized protein n=1 Tax=Heterostelium pallidum (strain ATCC 26659 / Pp 5 / PN500) TaxID=670386 RepID=D3B1S4_HETP5|nr:hypothetical protein PPL_02248 [Heterostelium album PN500]EFA85248.1 hypothetical protein PPL_02248 [Heterostelium album PN500]|eukprot:XP_020437357.1 hypothetical protein PPL_02248 [Heterostelium album PN500]
MNIIDILIFCSVFMSSSNSINQTVDGAQDQDVHTGQYVEVDENHSFNLCLSIPDHILKSLSEESGNQMSIVTKSSDLQYLRKFILVEYDSAYLCGKFNISNSTFINYIENSVEDISKIINLISKGMAMVDGLVKEIIFSNQSITKCHSKISTDSIANKLNKIIGDINRTKEEATKFQNILSNTADANLNFLINRTGSSIKNELFEAGTLLIKFLQFGLYVLSNMDKDSSVFQNVQVKFTDFNNILLNIAESAKAVDDTLLENWKEIQGRLLESRIVFGLDKIKSIFSTTISNPFDEIALNEYLNSELVNPLNGKFANIRNSISYIGQSLITIANLKTQLLDLPEGESQMRLDAIFHAFITLEKLIIIEQSKTSYLSPLINLMQKAEDFVKMDIQSLNDENIEETLMALQNSVEALNLISVSSRLITEEKAKLDKLKLSYGVKKRGSIYNTMVSHNHYEQLTKHIIQPNKIMGMLRVNYEGTTSFQTDILPNSSFMEEISYSIQSRDDESLRSSISKMEKERKDKIMEFQSINKSTTQHTLKKTNNSPKETSITTNSNINNFNVQLKKTGILLKESNNNYSKPNNNNNINNYSNNIRKTVVPQSNTKVSTKIIINNNSIDSSSIGKSVKERAAAYLSTISLNKK